MLLTAQVCRGCGCVVNGAAPAAPAAAADDDDDAVDADAVGHPPSDGGC